MHKYLLIFLLCSNAFAMRYSQVKVLDTASMSVSQSSIGIDTQQLADVSFHAVWTGAPTGSLIVQGSNDIVPINVTLSNQASNVVNWSDYGSAYSVTASGSAIFNLPDYGLRWVRLKYTSISGSGTVTASFFGKGP